MLQHRNSVKDCNNICTHQYREPCNATHGSVHHVHHTALLCDMLYHVICQCRNDSGPRCVEATLVQVVVTLCCLYSIVVNFLVVVLQLTSIKLSCASSSIQVACGLGQGSACILACPEVIIRNLLLATTLNSIRGGYSLGADD